MGVIASPEELRHASRHMQAAMEAVRAEVGRMEQLVFDLTDQWVGEGSAACIVAWLELVERFARMEQTLQRASEVLNTFALQIDQAAAPVVGIASVLGLPFDISGRFYFDALQVPSGVLEKTFKDSAPRIAAMLNDAIHYAENADRAAASALAAVGRASAWAGGAIFAAGMWELAKDGQKAYSLGKKGVQGCVQMKNGFALTYSPDGAYWVVKGRRAFQVKGQGWLAHLERAILASGRPAGTRYRLDSLEVTKYVPSLRTVTHDVDEAVNIFRNGNWSAAAKGAGVLGLALGVGQDVWDYAWGSKAKTGLASTDFAAAVTTDVVKTGVETGVAAGVSGLSVVGVSMLTGSVVPGVGTLVGAAVGAIIFFADQTPAGQRAWAAVRGGIKPSGEMSRGWSKKIGNGCGK